MSRKVGFPLCPFLSLKTRKPTQMFVKMPHRNPQSNAKTNSLQNILRRSPRFLFQEKAQENDDRNKTKKPNSRKKKNQVCPFPISTPDVGTDSKEDFSLNTTHEGNLDSNRRKSLRSFGVAKTKDNEITGSKKPMRSNNGLRRSLRFSNPKPNPEKVTKKTENKSPDMGNEGKARTNESKIWKGKSGKCRPEVGINGSDQFCRKGSSVVSAVVSSGGEKKKRKRGERDEEAGVEKRRGQCKEGCSFEGWSKEQEMALQRAYFSARPSPHFWKKVSKLVPGKSAQECFNRINSNIVTPNHSQPRSRTHSMNLSPLGHLTLSGSKLLEPIELNVNKRPKSGNKKILLSQKTVRHLLRKHSLVDQGYEADLFSVLEGATNSPTQKIPQLKLPTTPDCKLKPPGFLQEFHQRFPTDTHRVDLISPEVLKQVKNTSLHEKYIDQLHCREARRRTASTKTANFVAAEDSVKGSGAQKADLKAARTALVSDAMDVIIQFQNINASATSNFEEFDDDGDDDDDDVDDYECQDRFF